MTATSARAARIAWLTGALLALPASAQAQDAAGERTLFAHAQVAGGYWHYWQSNYADREFDGFVLDVHGAFAWFFGEEIAVGTTISVDLFYGSGRNLISDRVYTDQIAPGGAWGFFLAWTPRGETPPVTIDVSAGIGGGGNPHWGGGGPFIAPAVTFYVAHLGRSHLGITLRLHYQPMFSDDATPMGADKQFVMASGAFGWTFF